MIVKMNEKYLSTLSEEDAKEERGKTYEVKTVTEWNDKTGNSYRCIDEDGNEISMQSAHCEVVSYGIKASEIQSETVEGAIKEIEDDAYLNDMMRHIAHYRGWAYGDAAEAIATHIIYTDTDYNL